MHRCGSTVAHGRQAADHVVSGGRRGSGDAFDAIVVGAGPAGISATLRLMEAGLRVMLVEREAFGGTIMHYPRAKVVMTGALDFAIVGRVGMRKMSMEELVALCDRILQETRLPVKVGTLVEGVERDADGVWRAIGLVVAGAGVVALGVGSVFGLRAISLRDDLGTRCVGNECDTPEAVSQREDARSAATVSTVFFATGALLAAGGAVLYFTAPHKPTSPAAGVRALPGGGALTVGGRF